MGRREEGTEKKFFLESDSLFNSNLIERITRVLDIVLDNSKFVRAHTNFDGVINDTLHSNKSFGHGISKRMQS